MQFIIIRNIHKFLRFCGFYWKFIKNYSRLVQLLKKFIYKDIIFNWIAKYKKVF